VDGLGLRWGADLEPQRKVGFIRTSEGGGERTLQRCMEERTPPAENGGSSVDGRQSQKKGAKRDD
jgi:hypothetical protein